MSICKRVQTCFARRNKSSHCLKSAYEYDLVNETANKTAKCVHWNWNWNVLSNELSLNEDFCGGRHVKQGTADTHKSIHFKGFTFANCNEKRTVCARTHTKNDGKILIRMEEKQNICGKVVTKTTKKQWLENSFVNCRSCWKCVGKWRQTRKKNGQINEKHCTVHWLIKNGKISRLRAVSLLWNCGLIEKYITGYNRHQIRVIDDLHSLHFVVHHHDDWSV